MENKIRIGITGQAGFVGTHLFNFLSLKKDQLTLVPFRDDYFKDQTLLSSFCSQCDVIVHLAALNRHNDPEIIYNTNITLVQNLISALENTSSTPLVIFSSSTQEDMNNPYGTSKREGRRMLEEWAVKTSASVYGLIIPNVYGPFGNPFYNSVVATFSHQLTHDQIPVIQMDSQIRLLYVQELVEWILKIILSHKKKTVESIRLPHTAEITVSKLLEKLQSFRSTYFEKHIIPDLETAFDVNLFNTFRSYISLDTFFPIPFKLNTDERGSFVELIKLHSGGQVSFSITKPGITRGNHFHTRKIERFAVIKGEALIQLRKVGDEKILNFNISGKDPGFVDMPIWYTHNLINTGSDDLYTIFWISEIYNSSDPDTYFENVNL